MTATTFTPAPTARSGRRTGPGITHRLAFGLRAIRVFGAALVGVVLLGTAAEAYGEDAGVRSARPDHVDQDMNSNDQAAA
ncbi:hypothetical protein [Streptomyces sp. NPDC090025]|uniref:hypothetical protein n=1 Tax=Streptomyces sp. NPDC090025 TaxID=3365922 RepID=UPI003839A347